MSRMAVPVKHFGETLRASKYSQRVARDEYALVNKKNIPGPNLLRDSR